MPTNSRADQIIDAMILKLQNIVKGSTYHYSIHDRAYRISGTPQTRNAYPWAEVFAASSRPLSQTGYDSYSLYQSELQLEVWGAAQDNSDPQGAAMKIEQDIRTAIEADQTLAGAVEDIRWTGTTYSVADFGTGVGIAVVAFSALYFANRQDTSEGIA